MRINKILIASIEIGMLLILAFSSLMVFVFAIIGVHGSQGGMLFIGSMLSVVASSLVLRIVAGRSFLYWVALFPLPSALSGFLWRSLPIFGDGEHLIVTALVFLFFYVITRLMGTSSLRTRSGR